MFSEKYVSIKTVIENILRDTDYYDELSYYDAIEWAWRAMVLIGASVPYKEVVLKTALADYKASLPTDLLEIVAIRGTDNHIMFIPTRDEFLIDEINQDEVGYVSVPSYRTENQSIYSNVKTMDIDLKYHAFLLDTDDYPLIPDVARYMMAIEAYIIHKIDNKLYRKGKISKTIRDQSEQDWLFYVNSAFTKVVTPTPEEAEALKNQLHKIRVDVNAHDYGFSQLNTPTVMAKTTWRNF